MATPLRTGAPAEASGKNYCPASPTLKGFTTAVQTRTFQTSDVRQGVSIETPRVSKSPCANRLQNEVAGPRKGGRKFHGHTAQTGLHKGVFRDAGEIDEGLKGGFPLVKANKERRERAGRVPKRKRQEASASPQQVFCCLTFNGPALPP